MTTTPIALDGGGGPGGHPGVTLVKLTNDLDATKAALEAAFTAGAEFVFSSDKFGYAVFVQGYK